MKPETTLALRTLLNATFSMTFKANVVSRDHVLTEIANDITNDMSFLSNKSIPSNYLGVYSLQTHVTEKEVDKMCLSILSEIRLLAKLLAKCLDLYDKLLAEQIDKEPDKMPEDDVVKTLLGSVFQRLNLYSFTLLEHFDIRLWQIFLKHYFKDIQISDMHLSEKPVENVMSEPPSSGAGILERLLMRHALQMRTNGQAIFKIHSTTGSSAVTNLEQQRLATGYFPTLSMMNHSCSPNTTITFDGRCVQVIASRRIRKGEEISHCYGPHFCKHSFLERQTLLQRQYFFTCRCKMCSEDFEDSDKAIFRMQFHAFKCSECGDPIKPDLNTEEVTSGKCVNEGCGKRQSYFNARNLLEKAKRDCKDAHELLQHDEVKKALLKFRTVLEGMHTILYRNHLDIGYVNDQIAQCYAILDDYPAAIPHLTRSISISGMLYGTESIEIAHEYQKLASLYFNIRSFRLAARYSGKVLSAYATHYGDEKMFPPGADDMKKISELCQQFTNKHS